MPSDKIKHLGENAHLLEATASLLIFNIEDLSAYHGDQDNISVDTDIELPPHYKTSNNIEYVLKDQIISTR